MGTMGVGSTMLGTDHKYFELTRANDNLDGAETYSLPVASFLESRSGTILSEPARFAMSVVRFQVPTQSIPIMIVPIVTNPVVNVGRNPYMTPYMIVLTSFDGGTVASAHVEWVPQDTTVSTVAAVSLRSHSFGSTVPRSLGSSTSAQFSQLYYLWSVQGLVDCINATIATSYAVWSASMVAQSIGFPTAGGALIPPYFLFDPVTSLFSFIANTDVFAPRPGSLPPWCSLGVDTTLRALLTGFNYAFALRSDVTVAGGYITEVGTIKLALDPAGLTTLTAPGTGYTFVQQKQQISNLGAWSGVSTLEVQSNGIGSRAQDQSSGAASSSTVSALTRPVLTSFVIDSGGGLSHTAGYTTYIPPGEYRMVDMAQTNLTQLDIQFFWTDRYNNAYPLLVPPGMTINALIMFRRKGVV